MIEGAQLLPLLVKNSSQYLAEKAVTHPLESQFVYSHMEYNNLSCYATTTHFLTNCCIESHCGASEAHRAHHSEVIQSKRNRDLHDTINLFKKLALDYILGEPWNDSLIGENFGIRIIC